MTDPDAPPPPDSLTAPEPTSPEPTSPERVDPEDWESASGDDDERYQRERPPHWG